MKKEVMIGSVPVVFESSGDIPRMYRREFGKDILIQMTQFQQRITHHEEMNPSDLEMFENLAWTFAKHANPDLEDIDTWLKQFEALDILNSVDVIIEMWNTESKSTSKPKKKNAAQTAK